MFCLQCHMGARALRSTLSENIIQFNGLIHSANEIIFKTHNLPIIKQYPYIHVSISIRTYIFVNGAG